MSRSQETGAAAAAEEISARQAAVGGSWAHYGDDLVPHQSCFGQDTRALMNGLAVPVMNQFGLCPAPVKGTKNPIAPLTITKDLDKLGGLKGVTTFNFHLLLAHHALTTKDSRSIHVLARQPIDLSRPHPFHGGGKPGVQFVHQHAADGHTRRPSPAGRLDSLHHVVWWHCELKTLLA